MTPDLPLIEILYQALHSPNGIVVRTADPVRLRAKLYVEKKKDEAFGCLSFSISRTSPESELYIVKS